MGFSVSGSYAIIAVGTFIAIGIFYGAASNGAERVTESQQAAFDDRLEQQNTDINITNAVYNTSLPTNTLILDIENTGATALSVNQTDYLVDNTFVPHSSVDQESVDNDTTTELWLPGETLHVEITDSTLNDTPERVRIVTGPGIADTRGVS